MASSVSFVWSFGIGSPLARPVYTHMNSLSTTHKTYLHPHSKGSSAHADVVSAVYGAGTYMVTQMEDNAFGVVALNENKLDRLIVVRDVVNFDQPYTNQTVLESRPVANWQGYLFSLDCKPV
jgi:purine nucleoside permease